jgi:hypothetical protein
MAIVGVKTEEEAERQWRLAGVVAGFNNPRAGEN